MKKALVIALVAALSLSLLIVLAGCGSNQNVEDAKTYMNNGDDYMDAVQTGWAGLDEKQTTLISQIMGGDMSAITGAGGEATMADFQASFQDISSNLENANNEYEKITGLEGVEDYITYATDMMQAIVYYQQALQAAESLMTNLSSTLASTPPDQLASVLESLATNADYAALSDLRDQADSLVKEAKTLQSDKNLKG